MSSARLYDLSIDQCFNLIRAGAMETTVMVQGEMGTGKSSILKMLDAALPKHKACYFDCTTKDLGDIMIPKLKELDGNDYVRFATNEELGLHLKNTPVIIMVDEYGKANPAVKNALLCLMQERQIGGHALHPESLIFATSNLGMEGIGDLLPPHARNRITVVTMRKPTNLEWIEWGIENGVDTTILGWAKDNPQAFQSFLDFAKPDDNEYIFHPKSARTSFVSARSLHKASNWVQKRDMLGGETLMAALIGTIGHKAAMDLEAFVKLADKLPTLDSIKKDPNTAHVPESVPAICMVVYKVLQVIDGQWVNQWFKYLRRLPVEAQALFVNGTLSDKYSDARRTAVFLDEEFSKWVTDNRHLFGTDL